MSERLKESISALLEAGGESLLAAISRGKRVDAGW